MRRRRPRSPGVCAPSPGDRSRVRHRSAGIARSRTPGVGATTRHDSAAADSAPLPAHLLTDIVDLLKDDPDGRAILDALHQGQTAAVREALDDLVKSPAAAPRLLHHLALIEERTARALEEKSRYQDAALCWRRSWSAWLRCLAAEGYVAVDARRVLLDDLLAHHRRRVNELLASSAIDSCAPALEPRARIALSRCRSCAIASRRAGGARPLLPR